MMANKVSGIASKVQVPKQRRQVNGRVDGGGWGVGDGGAGWTAGEDGSMLCRPKAVAMGTSGRNASIRR